jgi:hypothetical protein
MMRRCRSSTIYAEIQALAKGAKSLLIEHQSTSPETGEHTILSDLELAPGCYGGALLFKADSKECRPCPFAATCGPKSAAMLARIKTELAPWLTEREKERKAAAIASDKKYRDRKRAESSEPPKPRGRPKKATAATSTLSAATVTHEWVLERQSQLEAWTTAGNYPMARQLRGRVAEIVKVAAYAHKLTLVLARAPSHAELAKKIGVTRSAAQNRARILRTLYAAGGPWH